MNILKKLSIKSLKLNKKRTLGTIIGIILSTSLICAVSGMATTFQSTLVQNAINETGYYHLEIYDVSEKNIKEFENNRQADKILTIYNLGYSILNKENKNNPYINIYSTEYFEDLSFNITEGQLPKNENEIIINKKVITDSNLKIGDSITLNIGERQTLDGYKLDDSNPYHEELEKLVNTKEHTYKIVGIFDKYGYNYNYYGFTTTEKTEKANAYISLKNPKNYKKILPMILNKENYDEVLYREYKENELLYDVNTELLRWEAFAFGDETVTMLTTVISTVIIIIIISSVFCIRNSFAISVSEKTKMYGMLSSIGATKKQIKRSVINEGLILGIIGVPLGILGGIFAVYVLVNLMNYILDGVLFTYLDKIIFNISYKGIFISCILSFITIYFSSLSSATRASHISPIENITNSEQIKLKPNELKTPKIINKIFKTGGTLAYKNLKRSKKKYRTTVISLTISIFVFISMNSFLNGVFDLSDRYYEDYDYNLVITGIKDLSDKELNVIRNIENIKSMHVLYDSNFNIKITDQSKINISDYLPLDYDCITTEKDEECEEKYYRSLNIIALDDLTFKDYIEKLKLNYDEMKTKGILTDEYKYYSGQKEIIERSYTYQNGEIIKTNINGKDINIEIGNVNSIKPYGYENTYYSGGYIILNKDYFKELDFTPYKVTIETDKTDEVVKMIETINSNIEITNYEEARKQDKAMKLIISIFLYGFITVITLIGVTSIFNTITSNMELRSKEFMVLRSIGMTKKEFKHMINLETIFYSAKSIIYGIILGLIGSYILHIGFSKKNETPFKMPYIPIILSIIFVFLLVYIIMKYSINKINKQNTIETIRNDNI